MTNNLESTFIKENPKRILLHINQSNREHFAAALTYTENFLETLKDNQIAVVENTGGLDLMRAGISLFKEQVSRIIKNYDNVKVEKPALEHIIDYVKKGWAYKKVKTLIKV